MPSKARHSSDPNQRAIARRAMFVLPMGVAAGALQGYWAFGHSIVAAVAFGTGFVVVTALIGFLRVRSNKHVALIGSLPCTVTGSADPSWIPQSWGTNARPWGELGALGAPGAMSGNNIPLTLAVTPGALVVSLYPKGATLASVPLNQVRQITTHPGRLPCLSLLVFHLQSGETFTAAIPARLDSLEHLAEVTRRAVPATAPSMPGANGGGSTGVVVATRDPFPLIPLNSPDAPGPPNRAGAA